jgi:hypothetical protein
VANKTQSPSPEGRRTERLKRWTDFASIASGFGTLITALIAVLVVLSKDMVHENIRLQTQNIDLLNQKVGLLGDQNRLLSENSTIRREQSKLEGDRAKISADLATAKEVQGSLKIRVAELARETVRREAQLAASVRAVDKLQGDAVALRAENAATSRAMQTSADQLLSLSMVSYLNQYEPHFTTLVGSGFYQYLIAEDDPAFAGASGAFSYFFFAAPASEFSPEDTRMSCLVMPGVRMLGVRLENNEAKMDFGVIRDPAEPVFKRVCRYLGSAVAIYDTPTRTRKSTVYEVLRNPNTGIVGIGLLPGAMGDLHYEEFKARGFWFAAVGNLYRSKALDVIDAQNGGSLKRMWTDPKSAPLSFTYDLTQVDELMKGGLRDEVSSVLRDRFSVMDTKWLEHLKSAQIVLSGSQERLQANGGFIRLLPRYRFADLGSADFMQRRDLVRTFDFKLMCDALNFGVSEKYFGYLDPTEAQGCATSTRIDDALLKVDFSSLRQPTGGR